MKITENTVLLLRCLNTKFYTRFMLFDKITTKFLLANVGTTSMKISKIGYRNL